MITKDKKAVIIEDLIEKLKKTSGLYVVDFAGMTVAQSIQLRRKLKDKGFLMQVAKNTLVKRALNEVENLDIPDDKLIGMSALIFGFNDPVTPAKILKEYTEKEKIDIPKLKVAIIEGQIYDGSQLKMLATLPTRDDMIASICGSLNAPISGIVGTINSLIRDVAYLVEEVAKKQAA
jgi:large subunit ribosomal protein L10